MNNNIKFSQSLRLAGNDKAYWLNQLQEFANQFSSMQVYSVQFGKQDMRGAFSIALVDHNYCVPRQHFFKTKGELLAFVAGYNMAQSNFNVFADFKKVA